MRDELNVQLFLAKKRCSSLRGPSKRFPKNLHEEKHDRTAVAYSVDALVNGARFGSKRRFPIQYTADMGSKKCYINIHPIKNIGCSIWRF